VSGKPTEENRATAEFFKFLSATDVQKYWHQEIGKVPIANSAYDAAKADGYYDATPQAEVGIQQPSLTSGEWSKGCRMGFHVQIRDVMNRAHGRIFAGETDVESAFAAIEAEGNNLLERFAKTANRTGRTEFHSGGAPAGALPGVAIEQAHEHQGAVPFPLDALLPLAPQMGIIAVFFLLPAAEAVRASFYLEDPFFGNATFVGPDNDGDALTASDYRRTAWFTVMVALVSLGMGQMLAVSADRVLRGRSADKTLLMWVYAIAPPVAGLIGVMLFDRHIGSLVDFAALFGWDLNIGVD